MGLHHRVPGDSLLIAGVVLGAVAWREPRLRRPVAIGAAWLLCAWLSARAPGRSYPHYFVVVAPPLALLVGVGIGAIAQRAPPAGFAAGAALLAVLAGSLALDGWRAAVTVPSDRRWMGAHDGPMSQIDEAAALVRRETRSDDRVYVVTGGTANGGQSLYWLADRRPAHRLTFPADMVPPRFAEVSADLARRPPAALVVISGAPLEPFQAAIQNGGLEVVGRFADGAGAAVEVWARR